jgi:hypothetical protein
MSRRDRPSRCAFAGAIGDCRRRGGQLLADVRALDDQREPELRDVDRRADHTADVEELRPAVRPVEMMDGHSAIRKPASWIFFIISRQMTPLFFSSRTRSKIDRRSSRKSQSTSRTRSPNSSRTA